MVRIAGIRAKLENLQKLAEDHFGRDPNTINWSDVGDIGRIESMLDEIDAE